MKTLFENVRDPYTWSLLNFLCINLKDRHIPAVQDQKANASKNMDMVQCILRNITGWMKKDWEFSMNRYIVSLLRQGKEIKASLSVWVTDGWHGVKVQGRRSRNNRVDTRQFSVHLSRSSIHHHHQTLYRRKRMVLLLQGLGILDKKATEEKYT